MPAKEIKELREAGKLDEALAMAQEELNAQPTNIWTKRNISWVYYAFLKKYVLESNFEGVIENLMKIKNLNLPREEVMIFDTSAYQIGSFIFKLQNSEPIDYSKIDQIFATIKEFHFTKPSEAYSFIYKAFHKGYQNWSGYLTFADWWDFEYLRSEDYLKEVFKDKKIMSVAEQAYIAYSKKLLEGNAIDPFGQQRVIDKEKIQSFLPKLDAIIEKYSEYQYPPYFKVKLLLALGSKENVLSAFLPFAKQKRNDFWVWELMAEIFADDKEIQFACYCKALSLKTPEDFLIKLRQSFAALLIEKQLFDEAKTEIQKVITIRNKQEWRLPNQITQWLEQEWYKTAIDNKNNKSLYSNNLKKAEEILFQDKPEELIAIEFVNHNKNMLNFVKNKTKFGFFNYSGHIEKPNIGDLFFVRFNDDGDNGFYKILTAKKAGSHIKSEAIRHFEGNLKVVSPQNFGFVEIIFIEPKIIEGSNLIDGQTVNGKAILSFNKKKDEWGWKAIEIE